MGLSVFLGVGTPGFKACQERRAEPPISQQNQNDNRRAIMEHVIRSTSGSRGDMRFEDVGDNAYKVTVSNGMGGDRAGTITFVVTKEELKRLGKAS